MGADQTVELSDAGYQFLIDLFQRHDKVCMNSTESLQGMIVQVKGDSIILSKINYDKNWDSLELNFA